LTSEILASKIALTSPSYPQRQYTRSWV